MSVLNGRYKRGFTLIELLMSIGIIILLTGMVVVSIRGITGSAKRQKTQVLIQQTNSLIKQGLQEIDKAKAPDVEKQLEAWLNNMSLAERQLIRPLPSSATDVMRRKLKRRYSFPQSFAEARDYSSLAPALQRLEDQGQFTPANDQGRTQSSELMYLLFTEGSVFGVPFSDSGEFDSTAIKDTDGDGLMEFVDAWGNPLRFYRCPTRLVRPNGNFDVTGDPQFGATNLLWNLLTGQKRNVAGVINDPDDPLANVVKNYVSRYSQQPSNAQQAVELLYGQFHHPMTHFSFLIVSAGPDGILGLEEPTGNSSPMSHLAKPKQNVLDILDDGSLNRNEKLERLYESETGLADNITNLMQMEAR